MGEPRATFDGDQQMSTVHMKMPFAQKLTAVSPGGGASLSSENEAKETKQQTTLKLRPN